METLRRLAVLGLLILLASTARAEEASLFSFAEDTPAPTVTALPTPAVTVTPESGFFLEVVREEEAAVSESRNFRVLIYHTHTYEAYTATEAMPYTPRKNGARPTASAIWWPWGRIWRSYCRARAWRWRTT